MSFKASLASMVLFLAGGGAFAQNWQPLNNDWDYYLEYDGQDIAQGWTYDPQTNQIISQYQETTWPETIQATQGIHNYSNNAFLTTYWYSEGTITLHMRWRHLASSRPETVGLVVESPANAQAVGQSPTLECDGGLGIDPWYQGNGLVTSGKRLRIVKIGGNGEGELEVEKSAKASVAGVPAWVIAEAVDLNFDLDGRSVSIISQFGTGWPKSPQMLPTTTRQVYASQDLWPWYVPLDPTIGNRSHTHTPVVAVPSPIEYSAFLTDFSEWHVALPTKAQLVTKDSSGNIIDLEPPIIPQSPSLYEGRILDVRPGEVWEFLGYRGDEQGTIQAQELSIILPYARMHDGPKLSKTQTLSVNGSYVVSESMSLEKREGQGDWLLQLKHTYTDGAVGESRRTIKLHLANEPGITVPQSGYYMDFNVGLSPASTFYQSTKVVDPLSGEPVEAHPGWVPAGIDGAIFRKFNEEWTRYKSQRDTGWIEYLFGILAAVPELTAIMAISSDPWIGALTSVPPPIWDLPIARHAYDNPGADSRVCDFLVVDLPDIQGTKAFDDEQGLLALKAQLTSIGTHLAYWKVDVRNFHKFIEVENLHFGPAGFLGQNFDRKLTPMLPTTAFRKFTFATAPQ